MICSSCPKRSLADRALFSAVAWQSEGDPPKDYGPHETMYNRFNIRSRLGVFDKIFAALAAKGGQPDRLMIDATHLKVHRNAASLLVWVLFPDVAGAPEAA